MFSSCLGRSAVTVFFISFGRGFLGPRNLARNPGLMDTQRKKAQCALNKDRHAVRSSCDACGAAKKKYVFSAVNDENGRWKCVQ